MEIIFYLTDEDKITNSFFKIVEIIYKKNHNLTIYSKSKAKLTELDLQLWSYNPISFLPHVFADDPLAPITPLVLNDCKENRNNSKVCIFCDLEEPNPTESFERVVYIKNDQEEVRLLIKKLQESNFNIIQYKQNKTGKWEQYA